MKKMNWILALLVSSIITLSATYAEERHSANADDWTQAVESGILAQEPSEGKYEFYDRKIEQRLKSKKLPHLRRGHTGETELLEGKKIEPKLAPRAVTDEKRKDPALTPSTGNATRPQSMSHDIQ